MSVGGILVLVIGVTIGAPIVGDLVSDEVRGQLDRVPGGLLGLAARRLPREHRQDHLDEWRGELWEILKGVDARPITRLVKGVRYAAGIFWSVREIRRNLAARPKTHAPLSEIPSLGTIQAFSASGHKWIILTGPGNVGRRKLMVEAEPNRYSLVSDFDRSVPFGDIRQRAYEDSEFLIRSASSDDRLIFASEGLDADG